MARSWKRYGMIFLLCAGAALLLWHEVRLMPDGRSTVVRFFDVGQGDSIFITGPSGQQVVIDGGPDLTTLRELGKSMPFFDRTIDLLILSHPHLDHVASFPEILKRYRVGRVLIPGPVYANGPYEEFLVLLKEQNIPIVITDPDNDLDLGDGLMLDVLWPPPVYFGRSIKSIHDSNVVVKMIYDDSSILFMGDAEEGVEEVLIKQGIDLKADILKVGHHGSLTSTSSGFLLAVDPDEVIISVAKENSYGLPHPWILERLKHFKVPYRMTMSGSVVITLNR